MSSLGEFNFGLGGVGGVGPQKFGVGQKLAWVKKSVLVKVLA